MGKRKKPSAKIQRLIDSLTSPTTRAFLAANRERFTAGMAPIVESAIAHAADEAAGNARKKRTETANNRKAWVRREYAEALEADPKDKAKARRHVVRAFPIEFPDAKPIAASTVKRYVSKPRKRAAN